MEGGDPKVVENSEGTRTTPSMVRIKMEIVWWVKPKGIKNTLTNPKGTIYSVKRLIGQKMGSSKLNTQKL